jgi:predicted 3-demethylubiquinone-9 3-methyltransferase (glyoxalase superfamily)
MANPPLHPDLKLVAGDLKDYVHGGWVSDWWGFTWMILAEAREVLTPSGPTFRRV